MRISLRKKLDGIIEEEMDDIVHVMVLNYTRNKLKALTMKSIDGAIKKRLKEEYPDINLFFTQTIATQLNKAIPIYMVREIRTITHGKIKSEIKNVYANEIKEYARKQIYEYLGSQEFKDDAKFMIKDYIRDKLGGLKDKEHVMFLIEKLTGDKKE